MFLNMLILMMLIIFSIISISFSNIFLKWMMMEFFSLLFIIFMNLNNKFKIISMIYFTISTISSLMLFFNLISTPYLEFFTDLMNNFLNTKFYMNLYLKNSILNWSNLNLNMILIQMILMLKIGLYPFHFWMPNLFSIMSWNQMFMFMTISKFIPIYFLISFTNLNNFIYWILLINSMIPLIMTFKEKCPKKILGYISIAHSSYFIMIGFHSTFSFMIYFMFYSMNLLLLTNFLKLYLKSNYFFNMKLSKMLSINFFIMMIIYNMFPPCMTFIFKWMFFYELTLFSKSLIYLFILLISSILASWIMLNSFKYFYIKKLFKKNNFLIKKKYNYFLIFYLLANIFLFHLFYLFIY